MPMAVMMESIENTRSMMMICTITQKNAFAGVAAAPPSRASTSPWISWVAFAIRNCAAADQDDVAPGECVAPHGEYRLGQPDQPNQDRQQRDAEDQRQRQPELSRTLGLMLGNPRDQHGDEDDVVDAENDLEHRQGHQRGPRFGTGEKLHHAFTRFARRTTMSLHRMYSGDGAEADGHGGRDPEIPDDGQERQATHTAIKTRFRLRSRVTRTG